MLLFVSESPQQLKTHQFFILVIDGLNGIAECLDLFGGKFGYLHLIFKFIDVLVIISRERAFWYFMASMAVSENIFFSSSERRPQNALLADIMMGS
jgi:hypothetical protein